MSSSTGSVPTPRHKRPWPVRVLIDSGIVLVIASLLGFLVVPQLVRYVLERKLESTLGRRVHLDRVRANLFTLSLTVDGLQVYEQDRTTLFASWRRLYVNAELASIVHRAPVLREIRLEAPQVRLVRLPDGPGRVPVYNVSDILARLHKDEAAPAPDSDEPARFSLQNIRIIDGRATLEDPGRGRRHELAELQVGVPFFSTLPGDVAAFVQPGLRMKLDGAPFVLEGRVKPFERSQQTVLELRVSDFDLAHLMPDLPLGLRFDVASARLDARVDFWFVRSGRRIPRVLLRGRVALRQVELLRRGEPLLAVQRLQVLLDAVELPSQRVGLDRVEVLGLDLRARRRPDEGIDLQPFYPGPLFGPAERRGLGAGSATDRGQAASAGKKRPPRLRLEVRSLVLNDASVRASGQPVLRVPTLELHDLALDLRRRTVNIASISSEGVDLRVRRQPLGKIDFATLGGGEDYGEEGGAPFPITVDRIQLRRWTIRLDDHALKPPVHIVRGPLSIDARDVGTVPGSLGTMDLDTELPREGRLTAKGRVGFAPFELHLAVDLRGLELLFLQPYFADQINMLVTAGHVAAKGELDLIPSPPSSPTVGQEKKWSPSFRFRGAIDTTGFAAVDAIHREPLVTCRSFRLGGVALRTNPFALGIGQMAITDFFSRLIILPDGRFNLQNAFSRPPPDTPRNLARAAKAAAEPSKPWTRPPITIDSVTMQGGRVSFTDRLVQPHYGAQVANLGGRLSGLSTDRRARAEVDLRGTVEQAGEVTLVGKVNPLSGDLFLDLKADVRNFELPPTSPYAVKYAGYGLSKGKLSLSLGYQVVNRKLEARNRLIVEQLTLGQKVESPTATKLPVRLAVSLLTDRHGVIDLDIPITGSLDDPKFKLFRAIIKALGKLIVKAVTMPFSMLADAYGGGDELSRIDFGPGLVSLDAKAAGKVRALAKALQDRPGLAFEIEGHAVPERDRAGLQQYLVEAKLRAQKVRELVQAGVDVPDPEHVAFAPSERQRLLQAAYDAGSFPKLRNFIGMKRSLPPAEMEKLLLEHADAGDEAMRELAQKRAAAVRDALTRSAPAGAGRLFVVAPRVSNDGNQGPRVELRLRKE